MLVDSGCTNTTISFSTYLSIPERLRPTLSPTVKEPALADGALLETWGAAWMELEVGGVRMAVEVRVSNIEVDGILGMDFLVGQGCHLDFQRYELDIKGSRVRCKSAKGGFFCARLVVTEAKVVKPGHETCVVARVKDKLWSDTTETDDAIVGLVEPLEISPLPKHDIMIARSVVTVGDQVLIPVCNLGSRRRKVKVGTVIASVSPVEICKESTDSQVYMANEADNGHSSTENKPTKSKVPDFLQDLLAESVNCVPPQYAPQVEALLLKYADVFSSTDEDIGRTNLVKHNIDTGLSPPIRERPRRLPLVQQAEVDKQVKGLLDRGLISPSSSPWSSQVTLAQKKDGKWRLCLDLRKVNSVTKKDSYPIPRIDESLDALSGAQWFCTMDLASGYWQVEMEEGSKEKTAFSVKGGLYSWNVMPFGLCNAPSTFERLMERVLSGLHWKTLLVYLDDIITFGSTVPETISRLEEVFQRLREAGLKVKPSKCHLFQREVHYLGHVVSAEGVSTEPEKVEVVRSWPTPSSTTEVRSFVGLVSYYRRFIADFSKIAKPLYKLMEKHCEFRWTEACESAFQYLKERLVSAPILAYPMAVGQYIVDCDASAYAIGGVLSQEQNGIVKVIAYGSRTLNKHERNYCVTRRELLAVVHFLKYYRHYIYGRKVLVRSDHGALRWLINFRDPEGQLARWLEVLSSYDLELVHRPGLKHGNADSLSRRPCRQCGRQEGRQVSHYVPDTATANPEPSSQEESLEASAAGAGNSESIAEYDNQANYDSPTGEPVNTAGKVRTVRVSQTLTLAEIREAQLEEPSMSSLLIAKEEGKPRPDWSEVSPCVPDLKVYWAQWDLLQVKNGVLCRCWVSPDGKETKYRVMIPPKLRRVVLEQGHGTKAAGHLGQKKTLGKLQDYYWTRMSEDVRSWLRQCTGCAKRKDPPRKRRSRLRQYQVGGPLERVAIDILGPLPETEAGNKFVLVIGDYFSKWMESIPISDQTAEVVAEAFVKEFVSRYGMPMELHSDQGSNFQSKVFKESLRLLGISQTRTCPYNPKSDGMVERFNRTLLNLVSILLDPYKGQRDWDQELPYIGMAYRSAVQESTGETPNMLMLGREVKTPLDLLVEGVNEEYEDDSLTSDYAMELRDRLRKAHERAREVLQTAGRRQKKQYDRKAHGSPIAEGTFVWLYSFQRKPGVSKKLKLPWEGPYLVVRKLSDVHCKIQRSPRSKCKIIHMDRLKSYEGPELKAWSYKPSSDEAVETSHLDDSQQQKPEKPEPEKCVSQQQKPVKSKPEKPEKCQKQPTTDTTEQFGTDDNRSPGEQGHRRNPHRHRQLPMRYR